VAMSCGSILCRPIKSAVASMAGCAHRQTGQGFR
jgi:hypothetical protein